MPEAKGSPPWGPSPIREGERKGAALDLQGALPPAAKEPFCKTSSLGSGQICLRQSLRGLWNLQKSLKSQNGRRDPIPATERRPPWGPSPIREGERKGAPIDTIGIFI